MDKSVTFPAQVSRRTYPTRNSVDVAFIPIAVDALDLI
jgi:hypothetical protein